MINPEPPSFGPPDPEQPPAYPGYAPGYAPQPGYGIGSSPTPGYGPTPGYDAAGPPAPGYGPAGPYPMHTRGTNGLAIAALVCSIAGFATCLTAPIGLVLALVALSQIKRTHEEGRGLAVAAAWIGGILTVALAVGLIWVAFAVAFEGSDGPCPYGDFDTPQAYADCVDSNSD